MVVLVDNFINGLYQLEISGHWFWNLDRDYPVLVRGYRGGSHRR